MSADGRAFVDTNVLVYAHDATAGAKRDAARSLVLELWGSRRGCLSVQVLQELYVAMTRKLPHPLDPEAAERLIEDLTHWPVHAPDSPDVVAAARVHRRYEISFWDAMIVHSAAALGCATLYSEDLNPGQRYDGVLVVDPFALPP
ncbi:MAG TPA: PIN domain-containing protein [Gaiellaceae bacterium]|jgi:predicted nucleic acid-binding protein